MGHYCFLYFINLDTIFKRYLKEKYMMTNTDISLILNIIYVIGIMLVLFKRADGLNHGLAVTFSHHQVCIKKKKGVHFLGAKSEK